MPSVPPDRPAPKPRRWRRRLARAFEVCVVASALGGLALTCSVPNTGRLEHGNPTSTAFIDLRRDAAAAAGKPFKLSWQWKRIGQISQYLRAAVIYSEDIHFYEHDGVDWSAIEHAFQSDLDGSKIGGSTITQQLAKNLYLSPARSLPRKAREMLIAFSLEDHLTKTRILELYLNVVEWGDGVFGAEAASRKWFGRSAAALTPAQAARLATALPNPITRAPNLGGADLTRKRVRLLELFRMTGLIDAAQEHEALEELGIAVPAAPASTPPGPVTHPQETPQPAP